MRQHRNVVLFIVFLLCFSRLSYALPEDTAKNMHITATSTLFNFKSGFNTYEGDVKIVQGETRLTADRVTTQNDGHHKIDTAIAYGLNQLAHYWTIPKTGDQVFHAKAKVIKFYPQKSTVVLLGDATVIQGNNSFSGAEIIYNIKAQTVLAPPNKNGRSTIIIEPAKLNS